ncbi:hypothetical protein [Streptomyces sp. V3I7]|uniref:hypothetical protein n=1 Tax=Streptomyces sp. V3I7 TaxID=3042278 RepID=UPI00278AB817|nr:hypothetical protein [Streptomyces sp. V3I7]MDQ0990720.1 hypothetical protein [Streptomyces sp. V3I7]
MDHNDEDLHRVQITARGPKVGIELNGKRVDPGAFKGYTISQQEGESAQVVLRAGEWTETVFDGLARVAVADAFDPGAAAAVFLAAIDPEELERAALARPDLGTGPRSLTEAMLTQLQEWARGL